MFINCISTLAKICCLGMDESEHLTSLAVRRGDLVAALVK